VGTFGKAVDRRVPLTANGLIFPALTSGTAAVAAKITKLT